MLAIDPSYGFYSSHHRLCLQIDVAVNATEAGIIKEFFVNEEDTVTVGQDLVRVELGGEKPASSGEAEAEKPKESTPAASESKPAAEPEQPKSQPAPSESEKPAPPPQKPAEKPSGAAAPPKVEPVGGNREERRVSYLSVPILSLACLIEEFRSK